MRNYRSVNASASREQLGRSELRGRSGSRNEESMESRRQRKLEMRTLQSSLSSKLKILSKYDRSHQNFTKHQQQTISKYKESVKKEDEKIKQARQRL